ncbi:hypothetical protein OG618_37360 (plasmid) [Kitasatospora sp. NBC_01246]|uniref:hypothetical protein n=1 Tax=Kitasatospora sp. NBC_01246 TaxID=2903570 RepID=UPI002E342A9F|nr:hypothetical protein [Kitasatospora sp. NBC_01246]
MNSSLLVRSPWFTPPADQHRKVMELTGADRRQAADRAETVAAYAALHAGVLGIHAPHSGWSGHPDGTAHYTDGALRLAYRAPVAGEHLALTALVYAACGTIHTFAVSGPAGLAVGQAAAAECPGHPDEPTAVLTLAAALSDPVASDPKNAACRCDEPGADPYQCPAAEFDACDHQAELPELSPFAGRARERDARVVRTCPVCAWSTSSWHVDDGSAEAELHGHVLRAHDGSYEKPAADERAGDQ